MGTAKPVTVKPPRASVETTLGLISFPSINSEMADDAVKPDPVMVTCVPPVNELGVIVDVEVTLNAVEAVFPAASTADSE